MLDRASEGAAEGTSPGSLGWLVFARTAACSTASGPTNQLRSAPPVACVCLSSLECSGRLLAKRVCVLSGSLVFSQKYRFHHISMCLAVSRDVGRGLPSFHLRLVGCGRRGAGAASSVVLSYQCISVRHAGRKGTYPYQYRKHLRGRHLRACHIAENNN